MGALTIYSHHRNQWLAICGHSDSHYLCGHWQRVSKDPVGSLYYSIKYCHHGPLTSQILRKVTHAPGLPGPFHRLQRKPLVSDPTMHHVPWCMLGSLSHGWRGKRFRHSRRMRNPQFYVSGKRPIGWYSSINWYYGKYWIELKIHWHFDF